MAIYAYSSYRSTSKHILASQHVIGFMYWDYQMQFSHNRLEYLHKINSAFFLLSQYELPLIAITSSEWVSVCNNSFEFDWFKILFVLRNLFLANILRAIKKKPKIIRCIGSIEGVYGRK